MLDQATNDQKRTKLSRLAVYGLFLETTENELGKNYFAIGATFTECTDVTLKYSTLICLHISFKAAFHKFPTTFKYAKQLQIQSCLRPADRRSSWQFSPLVTALSHALFYPSCGGRINAF